MDTRASILIAGAGGVTDRGLLRHFRAAGYDRVVSSAEKGVRLVDPESVRFLFETERPEYVVLTSVRSGGIGANLESPGEFIYENLQAQNNVIHTAHLERVKKVLFLGASCVYPKECPQPMKEEYFLTGAMEKTSEPYSTAKAAGIVMCQAYRRQYGFNAIVGIPATVYGPGEDEKAKDAHVLNAMVAKFREAVRTNASELVFWGTGTPRREFISSEDLADACEFLLKTYDGEGLVNIGTGQDVAIAELAQLLKEASGFSGAIRWDAGRPDGAMRKLLDSSRLFAMGWKPRVSLKEGVVDLL